MWNPEFLRVEFFASSGILAAEWGVEMDYDWDGRKTRLLYFLRIGAAVGLGIIAVGLPVLMALH